MECPICHKKTDKLFGRRLEAELLPANTYRTACERCSNMFNFDIILVNWNRLDYLKRTVASLIESGAVADCNRFIIVDNGSTEEGVKEFLNSLVKDYKLFQVLLPENRGWGTAVNEALGLSRAPYLLISNNDVHYHMDFHRKAWEVIEGQKYMSDTQKEIGILGVWRHTSHGFGSYRNAGFREMDDVPAVGWFLPKAAMEKVGMLPEKGPCFTKGGNGEDTAYVQMMKAAGWLVGVPTEDIATHIDGY